MAKAIKAEQDKKQKENGVAPRSKPQFKKTSSKQETKTGIKTAMKFAGKAKPEKPGNQVGVKRKLGSDKSSAKKSKVVKRTVEPVTKKERRQMRRKQQKNYDTVIEALHGWERLRRHDLTDEERSTLLGSIMKGMATHIHELSVKHDTARVVQCCLKFGSVAQRTAIFTELKDHILELAKLKYAKFIVKALLRYCTIAERNTIISSLYGHVCKLIRHTEASEIVELAYNMHASAQQRTNLMEEFYGPQFALFKSTKAQTVDEILSNHEDQRSSILKNMKEALVPLLEKTVVKHSIIHHALLEFLLHCDIPSRTEMIELLREVLVHILHTRDGSRVALQCIWHGNTKDRKVIIKTFKGLVKKICTEEHGHVVMLGIFDCIDDTVLVKKALLGEVIEGLEELASNVHGRRVLLYLLNPRNHQHFSPQFLTILTPGDNNVFSKKKPEVRHHELLECVSTPLIKLAAENASEWAVNKPYAVVLLQIVATAIGDMKPILAPLVTQLNQEFSEDHLVNNECGHWVVRRLLAIDTERLDKSGQTSFAEMVIESVPLTTVVSWAGSNRGSFILCSLLQSKVEVEP
eukprot:Em0011g28a